MKLFGSLKEIVSAVFRKDTYEITLRPNQSVTYSAARDVQLPAKDGNAVLVSSGDIVNADINASAAIAYSKLNLSNSIVNGDVAAGAAVAYSKLNLSGSIVNADISNTAAIDAAKIGTGVVSNTEFGYLDGVTSAIQTQLNGKQATITGAATTITASDLTASKALQSDASGKVSASSVTSTELGYVSGVTSAIQTQLGNKAAKGANSDITSLSGLTTALSIGQGGTGQTTQQAAMNALAGTQTANRVLRSDGTNTTLSQVALTTDVSGTLPVANGGTGITSLGSGVATFLGTPSSANLASAVTDETGSGSLVFGTSPTLSSPQVNSSLVVQRIATPSNPSAGFDKIYTKSDGLLYKLDSAGNEVAVGSGASGSGEINAVLNPSAATDTTGWAAGTSHTVTKDSSNSPLNGIVSTSFAISSSAAVALGSQTSTSGVYDAITLPSGLQNRKLKVEFFFTTPASSAGTWAVAVYQGSTKLALSTDSAGDTILPAGVTGGKFTAYFDSSSSSAYSLNLVQRTRTSANTLYITNVIVGPGIQPQGLAGQYLGQLSLTPANFGTVSAARFDAWRVGSRLRVVARFNNGTPAGSIASIALPSGYTLDSSALPTSTQSVGTYTALRTTSAAIYPGAAGVIFYDGSDTANLYFATNSGAVSGTLNKDTGVTVGFINGAMDVTFEVPIAQWAGSGTVQLAQNDVEYASNNSPTATTNDTTNFVYGPSGSSIPTVVLSGNITKQVRFQTPIQTGDTLTLEVLPSNGFGWVPVIGGVSADSANRTIDAFNAVGTSGIGSIKAVSATDAIVTFGRYRSSTGNWTEITESVKWRVRKSSAGAAVGFGIVQPGVSAGLVSASGLPGNTTGNPIASGYVGQEVTSSSSITTVTTGSPTYIAATYTLPAGVWLVSGAVHVTDISSGGVTYVCVNTESSALAVGGGGISQGAAANNQFVASSQPVVKVSSGSTVVNLYVFIAGTWQNGTDTLNTLIRAVRIA